MYIKEASMNAEILRGFTDAIILNCLLENDSYGYKISRSIIEKTNNKMDIKDATIYLAFKRMEKEGLITSYWSNDNTLARRKYYQITALGKKYLNKIKFCSLKKEEIKTSNLEKEEKEVKILKIEKIIDLSNKLFEEINTSEKRKKYIEEYNEEIKTIKEEKYSENKGALKIQEQIHKIAKNGANKNIRIINKSVIENQNEVRIEEGYFIPNRDKKGNISNYTVQEDEYGKIEYLGYFWYRTNKNNISKIIGKYRIVIDEEEIEFFYNNGFHIIGRSDTVIKPKEEAVILGKILEKNLNIKRILYEIIKQEMKATLKEEIINVGILKRNIIVCTKNM